VTKEQDYQKAIKDAFDQSAKRMRKALRKVINEDYETWCKRIEKERKEPRDE